MDVPCARPPPSWGPDDEAPRVLGDTPTIGPNSPQQEGNERGLRGCTPPSLIVGAAR